MNLELSRRRFVLGSLSLPAVALVDGGVGAAAARPPAPPRSARLDPELSGWRAVRAQFRLDPKLTHFATFILSSHPEPVRRRIAEHRAALDADPYTHVPRPHRSAGSGVTSGLNYLASPDAYIAQRPKRPT